VLDQFTKDVIATVLRVQDLRDVGVTLHVYASPPSTSTQLPPRSQLITFLWISRQLHSNRPPLPDVPAVYFVAPTLQNVRRIAQDLEKNLYESFHLSFVEPLSRALLEELAAAVAKDGTGELITQVGSSPKTPFDYPLSPFRMPDHQVSRCWTSTFPSSLLLPNFFLWYLHHHRQRRRTLLDSPVLRPRRRLITFSTPQKRLNRKSKPRSRGLPMGCSAWS